MPRQVNDLPLQELHVYKPDLSLPHDFNSFWEKQKEMIGQKSNDVWLTWTNYPVEKVEVADVVLRSFDETPLHGWYIRPKGVTEGPVLIHYHGYTEGRNVPTKYLVWALLGFTVVSFDQRGQGKSPDFALYENGSRIPGWMLSGIYQPENYYYTNVYRDSLAVLKWLKEEAPVKSTKLGAFGASQGGGLALASAGLDADISFVAADYPFMTHIERALNVALKGPYMEVVNYLKLNDPQYEQFDQMLRTFSYVDALHFCPRIQVPLLIGIGLEDAVAPPSSAFAAFNHANTLEKKIEVYPQFSHEFNPFQEEKRLHFIVKKLQKLNK